MVKKAEKKVTNGTGRKRSMTGFTEIGTNVGSCVGDGVLYLAIKLSEDHGETSKGYRRIGTTHGNKPVPGHESLRIGLFVYDRGEE